MKPLKLISVILLLLFSLNCGGGSSGGGSNVDISSLSEDEQEAYNNAGDINETLSLYSLSGSAAGLWSGMATTFPDVTTLIAGGDDVKTALEETFTGTKTYENDMQLAIFAYVLSQIGDSDSLAVLREFLGDNLTADLDWAPHFISRTIEVLSNVSNVNPTGYYNLTEMTGLSIGSIANISTLDLKATDFAGRATCKRQYILVDGSGDPITYTDAYGVTQNAVVSGTEHRDWEIPETLYDHYVDLVIDNNGFFVDNDTEFEGMPTKQFNCAGYSFRHFNNNTKWTASPAAIFDVMVRTGLMTLVADESTAQVGDKVFWYQPGGTLPSHVGDVYQVQGGDITIRNADNKSGLFDADIDSTFYPVSNYSTRKIYRWTAGSPPSFVEDPSVRHLSSYCNYVASDSAFLAIPSVSGWNLSFTPGLVGASNNGWYSGDTTVSNLPGILAGEGTTQATVLQDDLISMTFDRRQITEAGTYSANGEREVIENQNGQVYLTYSTPSIVHEDNGSDVIFAATGGTVTLTSYGENSGDRLTGTYVVTISGTRTATADGSIEQTHTGTIFGAFDVEIE